MKYMDAGKNLLQYDTEMANDLIIPTELPFDTLKGRDLEECLYWIMDAMGGRDLEWRLGGAGGGAADGGRDLEARFMIPTPDGEVTWQKWWVEAKGRSSTVEPAAVKEAVLNAAARTDLDVVIIATNTTFSNATRDWVADWQSSHRRPAIRLWDRYQLERVLSGHPQVVIRLFAKALSAQGKLEVLRSRFWNYNAYAGELLLDDLWAKRAELEWSDMALVATIMSECANGSIVAHPWPMTVNAERRLMLFAVAFANTLYFCSRADDAGVSQDGYLDGLAYLLLSSLRDYGPVVVEKVIESTWADHDSPAHGHMRRMAIAPAINRLAEQLRDVCTADCKRVMRDPTILSDHEIDYYWYRLRVPTENDSSAGRDHHRQIIIENGRERCAINLALDEQHMCPITYLDHDEEADIGDALTTLHSIVRGRAPKTRGANDAA